MEEGLISRGGRNLTRGTTRISGSLSCGAREVRSPCAWRGGLEMRPSSIARNPAENREAPQTPQHREVHPLSDCAYPGLGPGLGLLSLPLDPSSCTFGSLPTLCVPFCCSLLKQLYVSCPFLKTICLVLIQCMKVKSESEIAQSCPTLSDPMDCSLPGSSVHGIFQARVREWVAISFSNA